MIELVSKDKPTDVVAYACSECRYVARSEDAAKTCCAPVICECGAVCCRPYTACVTCRGQHEQDAYARRVANAEVVDLATLGEHVLHSERYDEYYFHDPVAEYLEACDERGDEPEPFLWLCSPMGLSIDADSVIEAATNEHHEDAYYECCHESLQRLLDGWCAKQGVTSWYPTNRLVAVEPANG